MQLTDQLFSKKNKKIDVVILGVTGSIGTFTLNVIRAHPERFNIIGIAANSSVVAVKSIIDEFGVTNIAMYDEKAYQELKQIYSNDKTKHFFGGNSGVMEIASIKADLVVAAISGISGLMPTIQAIKSSKRVALANKEALICGGNTLKLIALEYGAEIIPVDSEHNSAFQLIKHEKQENIKKLTITASGGPFLDFTQDEMANITKEQAVKHPNWSMGAKISVDSATLVNKGLELIEAYYLFDLKPNQLDAVIHRSSIVHSIVDFIDGTTLINMYNPSMIVPISYALSFCDRLELKHNHFDIIKDQGKLQFENINLTKFPAFAKALEVLHTEDQSLMIVYNSSNEFAVDSFLKGKIKFNDISKMISEILGDFNAVPISDIEHIIEVDKEVKIRCAEMITEGII